MLRAGTRFLPLRWGGEVISIGELAGLAKSVGIDDKRMEAILAEHVKITDEQWSDLRNHEFWLTADDALASGIVTEIGEFSPPKGQKLYTLTG